MNKPDAEILEQLLVYCTKIEQRIVEYRIDEEKFLSDSACFDMLLMPLFQIGELTGALSTEFVEGHPEIPWRAIVGFRNVIAHDYGVVDPMWVWNTIASDIPALADFLKRALRE